MSNGKHEQPAEAEEKKPEDPQEDQDEAPQVDPKGGTSSPPGKPPED